MNAKKVVSVAVLLVLIVLFASYVARHASDFKQLSLVNPLLLIPIVIISLFASFTNGLVIKYLVEPFKLKLKIKEWFGLSVITTFYNTLLPFRGGLIAKAAYLKKKHAFSFTSFIAMMAGIYVISFLIASFLGIASLFFIYLSYRIFNIVVFLVFLGVFLVSLFVVLFSPKIPETKNKFLNKAIGVVNGWHLIKGRKKIIFIVAMVTSCQILASCFSTMLAYNIFGISIGFVKALLLASIVPVLVLVGITPAGLGINETVSVFLALTINIQPAQSLTVALLARAVSLIITFILGPIFSYKLLKGLKMQKKKE